MGTVKYAIKESKRLTFSFYRYRQQERNFIENTLSEFLRSINQEVISNQISFCLHELASNSCKANSKRVYFKEIGLNINNSEDYKKGIEDFKEAVIKRQDHFFKLRKREDLYIKFQIKRDDCNLYISIINNVPLTDQEQKRIDDKFLKGSKYSSIIDAFEDIHDQSEGAGLGIFTMLIMLKEIGLKDNSLKIFTVGSETHSAITIKIMD